MNEQEAKELLSREGYSNIYTWFDSPETEYQPHVHPTETTHIIVEGDMTVIINEQLINYQSGDRIIVPADTEHAVTIGFNGCLYVNGER